MCLKSSLFSKSMCIWYEKEPSAAYAYSSSYWNTYSILFRRRYGVDDMCVWVRDKSIYENTHKHSSCEIIIYRKPEEHTGIANENKKKKQCPIMAMAWECMAWDRVRNEIDVCAVQADSVVYIRMAMNVVVWKNIYSSLAKKKESLSMIELKIIMCCWVRNKRTKLNGVCVLKKRKYFSVGLYI